MRTITVNRFEGIAQDIYAGNIGEFSISKHFDTLTYPNRLYPLRGMIADTTGTGIGNLLIGSDNNFYGLGWSASNHALGAPWTRASGSWVEAGVSVGNVLDYNCFVEYHKSDGTRALVHGTQANLIAITPLTLNAVTTHALTFTNIAQGFVHPKNDNLYIPYDNKIALNDNGTWTDAALVLPANYRITSLIDYGNYLAIAATPSVDGVDYGGGGANSTVFLWDMDPNNDALPEPLDWGTGKLKWLNNLGGILLGISESAGNSSNVLDRESIIIKAYDGSQVAPVLEISTTKQTTSTPSVSVNPRVNFKYRGRAYSSIDIVGGSTSPSFHGLWSIGKSKLTGRFMVTLERVATTDNSETAVLAAALSGDVACMVYNSEGTLSITDKTASAGDKWTATSVHETVVNPEMPATDKPLLKQLAAFAVHYVPLPSTGEVIAQYRVDGGAWTAIFTETTDGVAATETKVDANGDTFKAGRNYEFRLQSTGFAQILGYTYKYGVEKTDIN